MSHRKTSVFTIGVAGKSAEQFFNTLRQNNVRKIMDVRLFNRSQLAGFTKQDDLRFFLKAILDVGYEHAPLLAPAKGLLDGYKKKRISWDDYEREYLKILEERQVDKSLSV